MAVMIQSSRFRLILFGLVIIGGFGLLLSRLWYLQFQKQEEYAKKLPGTKEVRHRFPGPRGRILDRNGVELAKNRSVLQVGLDLGAIVQYYADIHKGEKGGLPKYEWDPAKAKETDIVAIVKNVVIDPLFKLGLASSIHEDPKDEQEWEDHLRIHYRSFKGEVPFNYIQGLKWDDFAKFAEHNLNLPGVTISQRFLREYPYGPLTGHLIGYVKLFDKEIPVEDKGKYKFYEGDDRGVAGLEKTLDKYLRGKPGFRTLLINEHGRLEREVKYEEARSGDDVYLTIDIRAQYAAEMALRDAGIGRGAVVAQDPNTGEVLSMVAVPNYDPNKFIPKITVADYKIYKDDMSIPLLNRAISSFAPGSVFKIPVALAGFLAPGQMNSYYNCNGSISYGAGKPMHCWIGKKGGSHGSLDLIGGIKNSCNCFFFQYGNDAGIDNINKICNMLGLGVQTGIELEGESPGLVPGKAWLKSNGGGVWGQSTTANVSIGQGAVIESPLQMTCVASTVANGGKAYYPTLVHHRVNNIKESTSFKPRLRADLLKENVSAKQIELVRKGMWSVVNAERGTGKSFLSDMPEIAQHGGGAGKTGTAQAWRYIPGDHSSVRDDNTWFMCFAPYESPKVALSLIVQGGKSGGGTASPIAKRVVEQTLAILNGSYKVDLATIAKLTEAKGHFKLIDSVSYGTGPNVPKSDDDADVPDDEPPPEKIYKPKAVPAAVPTEAPSLGTQGNVVAPKARVMEGPQFKANSPSQ
jgi:penicillin-binding protein 2